MSNRSAGEGEDDLWAYPLSAASTFSPDQSATPTVGGLQSPWSEAHSLRPAGGIASPSIHTPARAGLSGGFFAVHGFPEVVAERVSPSEEMGTIQINGGHDFITQTSSGKGAGSKVEVDLDKGKSVWSEALLLVDQLALEHKKLKVAYNNLQAERTTIAAKLAVIQAERDKAIKSQATWQVQLSESSLIINQLNADKVAIEFNLSQAKAAATASEHKLVNETNEFNKATAEAERKLGVVRDEKRMIQLELDSSNTKVTSLAHQITQLRDQITDQANQHVKVLATVRAEHHQWSVSLVREKDAIAARLDSVVAENASLVAERNKLVKEHGPIVAEMRARSTLPAENEALRNEINSLHQDRARLSQDYARVAAERAGAIDHKEEMGRALIQLKLENESLKATQVTFGGKSKILVQLGFDRTELTFQYPPSPVGSPVAARPDTPPQSPQKVARRLSSFSSKTKDFKVGHHHSGGISFRLDGRDGGTPVFLGGLARERQASGEVASSTWYSLMEGAARPGSGGTAWGWANGLKETEAGEGAGKVANAGGDGGRRRLSGSGLEGEGEGEDEGEGFWAVG